MSALDGLFGLGCTAPASDPGSSFPEGVGFRVVQV